MSADPSGGAVPDASPGAHAAKVTLGWPTAARITELLQMLAELPSTPSLVAEEARYRASELSWALPEPATHLGRGERQPTGPVVLGELVSTGLAALLDLLSGMPSTPPDIAAEAQEQADAIWGLIASAP
jgi:hypothetical protein